jgi:hypothetical protein
MIVLLLDAGLNANRGGDIEGDLETSTGGKMAVTGVTWEATIMIRKTGNQERVRVQATREFDAKYLIQMLYKDATIIAGPVRVDLMRAL